MFFKSSLAALVFGLGFALSAGAQIESESMSDIDAWGTRFQDAGEPEFPSTLWSGSDAAFLLEALESVSTDALTSAERRLLRRALLTPSRPPTGEKADALLAERARILLELGEADAAAAIAPRLNEDVNIPGGETIGVDLEIARGQEATACGRLEEETGEDLYWLKLRAVCAVMRENYTGAELTVELAAVRGLDDPWFVEAIFAASGDDPTPPEARFDSGLNIALSSTAALDLSSITLSGSRPDLTALAAQRTDLPLDLRLQLARRAAEAELLEAEDWRELITERLALATDVELSELEATFVVLTAEDVPAGMKAEVLAEALFLSAGEPLPKYASMTRLFQSDLETLPANDTTAPYAILFAKAALIAGDASLARRWLDSVDFQSVTAPSSFEVAELEAVEMILQGDAPASRRTGVQIRLLASLLTETDEASARRLLASWTGLGLGLSSDARAFLLIAEPIEPEIDANTMLSIRAAAQAGAIGEAILMILRETNGDPAKLTEPDLASVLDVLVDIGAEDIASQLAVEASGFWQN